MKYYLQKIKLAAIAAIISTGCLWAQDAPTNLVYNPFDTTPTTGIDCNELVDATTFSSPSFTTLPVTHASIEDIEFYGDHEDCFVIGEKYTEAFDNGNFGKSGSLEYAIVSNPRVLNASYAAKDDGINRLVCTVGHNSEGDSDLLFTYKSGGFKPNSQVRLKFTVEDVTNSSFHEIKYRTNLSTGDQFYQFLNQSSTTLTISSVASTSGNVSFTILARLASPNSAYAISDVKIYGCAVPEIDNDLGVDVIGDGESCTLTAFGLNSQSGDYIWYHATNSEGPWEQIANTGNVNKLVVEPVFGDNYYYCTRGNTTTYNYKLVCRVECGSPEDMVQIWQEDFGQIEPGQRICNENVIGHTCAETGEVGDGKYCVVSDSETAGASGFEWIATTDHTGNENGGFLVVNIAAEPGDIIYQQEVEDNTLCPEQYYFFSAYVMNPCKLSDRDPCNVSFKIEAMEPNGEYVEIGYGESGLLPSGKPEWVLAGGSFNAGEYNKFRITMTALSEGSWGNDIFVDDLSFALCSPSVTIAEEISGGCGDMVNIKSDVTTSIDRFYPEGNAYCLWQSTQSAIGRNWANLDQSGINVWDIKVEATEDRTYYRLIVAKDQASAERIAENGGSDDNCEIYVITNRTSVICDAECQPPVLKIPSNINAVCAGSEQTITVEVTSGTADSFVWEKNENGMWVTLEETGSSLTVNPEITTKYRVSAHTGWAGSETGCYSETYEFTIPILASNDFTLSAARPTNEVTCAESPQKNFIINLRATDNETGDNVTSDMNWKWYINGVEDQKITNASYVFPTVSENTIYKIVANNACYSHEITREVYFPKEVTMLTTDMKVCRGAETVISASGGDEGTYQWGYRTAGSNQDWTMLSDAGSSITVNPEIDTEYMVRAGKGSCLSNEAYVTISINADISIEVSPSYSHIELGESITLTLNLLNGDPDNITWYCNGEIINGENGYSIIVTPQNADNTYTAVASDNCGEATAEAEVNVHIPCTVPDVEISATATDLCPGQNADINTSILNGVEIINYEWSKSLDGDTWEPLSETGASINVSPKETTQYRVIAHPAEAECISEPQTIELSVLPELLADFNVTPDKNNIKNGETIEMCVAVTNGNADNYIWSKNGQILDENGNCITDSPSIDSQYYVTISDRCTSLQFMHEVYVQLPTLFTPYTKDGANDTFMEGDPIRIFDRYGNLVRTSDNGWDGTADNGAMVQPGVYYYIVDLGTDGLRKGRVEVYK